MPLHTCIVHLLHQVNTTPHALFAVFLFIDQIRVDNSADAEGTTQKDVTPVQTTRSMLSPNHGNFEL